MSRARNFLPAVFLSLISISFVASGSPEAPEAAAERFITLDAAVARALSDNPDLAEMQARARAMAAVPSQVGTLPDPMVSFGALNLPTDTFDLRQEPMTQLQLGVSQAVPFPGKLGLLEQAAEYEAAAARDDAEETRLLLVRDVRTLWWRLFFLDRAIEIVANNQDLLRQFVEIAQTKYKVGQGLQQDVLLAQLELSRLLDQEIQLAGMRGADAARFNALLNLRADAPVRLPAEATEELLDTIPETKLFDLAESARPLLARQRNVIDAAGARLDLAKKEYLPDFKAGAAYGFRSGRNPEGGERADFATFQLSANVPLFAYRKQSKGVDQRQSELLMQQYALQDARRKVQAEISSSLADYRRARDQVELFRSGIIPQARQTVASMLAGYQVNKVDFLNLVRSQITLFNYETQYWRALSEANQALVKLAAAAGREAIDE